MHFIQKQLSGYFGKQLLGIEKNGKFVINNRRNILWEKEAL